MLRERISKSNTFFMLYFFVLSVFFSTEIYADEQENVRKLVQSGEILPLETILKNLNQRTSGRILEVEIERKKGRLIYEIEIVDEQGVVKEFIFDASTGDILKEKVED